MKKSGIGFIKRTALVLCTLILASNSSVVMAADLFSDETSRIGNGIFFYNPADTCGTQSAPTAPVAAVTDNGPNAETILRFFVGKGLTLAAAAGFAGNMQQESGLSAINVQNEMQDKEPNASVNGKGDAKLAQDNGGKGYIPIDGVGIGIVQWTWGGYKKNVRENPDNFNSRQGALYKFAKSRNMDIVDINLQLEYAWQELNTGYKTSTLDKLSGMRDPVEAAVIVHDNYEISGDSASEVRSVRGGNAKGYYDQFKGKIAESATAITPTGSTATETVAVTDTGTCATEQVDLTGGVGEANGLTFPLMTTKDVINKGINGAIWRPQECALGSGQGSAGNCHHDYNAADIFAPTGTKIIAAKAGKVVSKTTGACGHYGCNVSVKGDDGLLYYYTHMNVPATVNVGQKVQSGDELGRVGTDASAMDTPRHLHFDITRGDSRPSCSGSSCDDSDFINVQPILIPAFNNLPGGGATADV